MNLSLVEKLTLNLPSIYFQQLKGYHLLLLNQISLIIMVLQVPKNIILILKNLKLNYSQNYL
jgi:hypothetical protein